MSTISTSIARSTLHAKNVARAEQRENKAVGKMASSQIISYLCYRHRGFLLITTLIATNLLWILHYSHQ